MDSEEYKEWYEGHKEECPCNCKVSSNGMEIAGVKAIWLRSEGGLSHLPPKFEHIFVAVITSPPFLLCRYFYYQLVAYCVCFKMICKKSL